jgi:hypothetical protein
LPVFGNRLESSGGMESNWYGNKKDFASKLIEDNNIRTLPERWRVWDRTGGRGGMGVGDLGGGPKDVGYGRRGRCTLNGRSRGDGDLCVSVVAEIYTVGGTARVRFWGQDVVACGGV